MYRALASKLTTFFVKKNVIEEKNKDIYAYGFEMIIATIVYGIIFLAIAALTRTVLESIFFWLGLFIIRKTAGGHHAKSYHSCHLLFAANHILYICLLKIFPIQYYGTTVISVLIFSLSCVFFLAPVDHKNKSFIKGEYKRFKLLSRIYCIVLLALVLLFIFNIFKANSLAFSYTVGTLSATISLISAKIIRNKERKSQNEETV